MQTRARLGIDPDQQTIGLFPGSRHSEISRLLPLMFATARQLQSQDAGLRFVLPVAESLDYEAIARQAGHSGVDIQVTRDGIYDVITACDAIVTCSGTVTLEIALLGTPMCIVYKVAPLTYWIMKRLVTIPHIGLVNIVAQREVVRELLQADANPGKVATELRRLLDDRAYRADIGEGLEQVCHKLEIGNGAQGMAGLIDSLLAQTGSANDTSENGRQDD